MATLHDKLLQSAKNRGAVNKRLVQLAALNPDLAKKLAEPVPEPAPTPTGDAVPKPPRDPDLLDVGIEAFGRTAAAIPDMAADVGTLVNAPLGLGPVPRPSTALGIPPAEGGLERAQEIIPQMLTGPGQAARGVAPFVEGAAAAVAGTGAANLVPDDHPNLKAAVQTAAEIAAALTAGDPKGVVNGLRARFNQFFSRAKAEGPVKLKRGLPQEGVVVGNVGEGVGEGGAFSLGQLGEGVEGVGARVGAPEGLQTQATQLDLPLQGGQAKPRIGSRAVQAAAPKPRPSRVGTDVRDVATVDDFAAHVQANREKWHLSSEQVEGVVDDYARAGVRQRLKLLDASEFPEIMTVRSPVELVITGPSKTEQVRLLPDHNQVRDLASGKITLDPEDTVFVRHRTTQNWAEEFMDVGIDTRDAPPDMNLGRVTVGEGGKLSQARIREPGLFVEPNEIGNEYGVVIQAKARQLQPSLEGSERGAKTGAESLYGSRDAVIKGEVIPPENIVGVYAWDTGKGQPVWLPNSKNPNSGKFEIKNKKLALKQEQSSAVQAEGKALRGDLDPAPIPADDVQNELEFVRMLTRLSPGSAAKVALRKLKTDPDLVDESLQLMERDTQGTRQFLEDMMATKQGAALKKEGNKVFGDPDFIEGGPPNDPTTEAPLTRAARRGRVTSVTAKKASNDELQEALEASLAESKADPNPGFVPNRQQKSGVNQKPASAEGHDRFKQWQVGENRRKRNRAAIRAEQKRRK